MNSIRSLRPWYLKLQKIIFFAKLFSSELCLLDLIWLGSLNRRLRSYEPPESRLMDSCFTCFFSRSFPLPFIFHFLSHFFPLRLHIFACFYTSGKLLGPGATVVMMRKLMLLFLFMLWFPTLNYQWGWNRWSYHQPIFLLLGILVILVGPDRFILRRSL